jgi:acetyltransferase-like isoleucine patch superfamily enzyme
MNDSQGMGDIEHSTSEYLDGGAQQRVIQVRAMPFWRKRHIAWGMLRAALWHRVAGLKRWPVIHSDVKVLTANGTVRIGHLSEIHERVALSAIAKPGGPHAKLTIGDYTSIWYGTVVSARHEITIGSQCAISWNCTIIDNDMHEVLYTDDALVGRTDDMAVRIGDHVWIGAQAIILKGVTIGANSVVAAGSIVTKDVPSHTLVAGAPARQIRTIAGWR